MKNVRIYLISDSVGETAQKLIAAVSAQFPTIDLSDIQLFPFTNDEESLGEILKDALLDKSIVVTTLVNKELVAFVDAFAKRTGLQYVDFMSPLTTMLEKTFGVEAVQEPGALQDALGCRQGGLGIVTAKMQLYHIQSTIGQGFQPLAGLCPHLGPLPIQLGNEQNIIVPPLPDGLAAHAYGLGSDSITLALQ